jgi:long-chain fatty acid transport protein
MNMASLPRRRRVACILAVLGMAVLSVPYRLAGQQDASFAEFQLNRSLPGARSLAMSGAFVAVADDATAAYANPAGLTLLTRREVSIEGRQWASDFDYTDSGRISGTPSGVGLDTRSGLATRSGSTTSRALSFLSYVDALPHRHWVLAAFYRTYAHYHSNFNSQGVFSDDRVSPRFGPYHFSSSFDVDSLGVSWANQYGDCVEFRRCIRVGLTFASYSLDLNGVQWVYPDPLDNGPSTFSGPRVASAYRTSNDRSNAVSAGILWEPQYRLALGLAARQGPTFDINQQVIGRNSAATLSLPHEYSVGGRWRQNADTFLTFEIDRILYSRLLKGNSFVGLSLPNATEFRVGAERIIHQTDVGDKWSVMMGFWYDPDHHLVASSSADLFRRSYFRGGSSEWHASAGFGAQLRSVQTNVGFDLSRRTRTAAASFVLRL